MKLKIVFAVLLLSGCSLSLPERRSGHHGLLHQPTALRQSLRAEHQQPVDKFNFIDIELLQLTADIAKGGNVVLSPASVKTTLSMLWEGADGHTAQEIGLALRLGGARDKQENQLHDYQDSLVVRPSTPGAPTATLEVASQVFVSNKVSISPAYNDTLNHYRATAKTVDMRDAEQAANTINKWVQGATRGHIPSLVEPESLRDNPAMVVANAVFFQGTWQIAFDPQATRVATFYADGGEELKVKMMETMGSFRSKLIQELDATLLELPYDDPRYSMLILLPERRDGMPELMYNLAFANLLHVLNGDLEDSEYVVSIPQFTIEYNTDLVPVLSKLRVVDVFTSSANLSKMITHDANKVDLSVSNVFHKAKILVDERGAIAAGATGALVVPLMGGPQPRFQADHPFLFFIRDMKTGGFLFAGRVSRPQSDGAPMSASEATAGDNDASSALPASATSNRSQASPAAAHVKESAGFNFPSNSDSRP